MNGQFTNGTRRSALLHRRLDRELPVAVRGEGPYLFDDRGRRYIDASGGAAVSCLGHSHPAVIEAATSQIRSLAFAHTSFFTTEPAERLAEFIVSRAPAGISRAVFVCDGSEAVETAIKLARQYWIETGNPSRQWIISRRLSYHGMTFGALSASGHSGRRRVYEPYLSNLVEFIDPCYEYRNRRENETLEAYGRRAADQLEETIKRIGPDRVAAFIAEPVGGATAGCLTPAPGYLKRIREICDRHGVLFIADEVMCGMGRTGSLFACAAENAPADLITVAKGLAAGYQSVGAVLANEKIVRAIEDGGGALAQGHTYMNHPVACAAALAVQEAIERENLLANVRAMGSLMERRLRETFRRHPNVGDIRGRGLFWAIELVQDRAGKQSFDTELKVHARIKQEAMNRGLICYPSGGTADGVRGDHVLLAPPYIVNAEQIEEIVDKLAATLNAVLSAQEIVQVI